LLQLALTESAKLLPYIVTSRKAVKLYLKVRLLGICDRRTYYLLKKCLELWSSAQDNIRITAFLSIRKLATASDASIMDHILKVGVCTLPDLYPSIWAFLTSTNNDRVRICL
jgi:nucleolar complex protein 2